MPIHNQYYSLFCDIFTFIFNYGNLSRQANPKVNNGFIDYVHEFYNINNQY